MQLLSASESYLLGRRFRRLLRWAGLCLALCACALSAVSIVQDYQATQRSAHDTRRQLAESLRHQSEAALEQGALSLTGLGQELQWVAPLQGIPDEATLHGLLSGAIRFDTLSQLLFVRRGELIHSVDRQQHPVTGAEAALRRLSAPEIPGRLELRAPIRLDDSPGALLPMLLRLELQPGTDDVLLGALLPLASLRPPEPPAYSESGDEDIDADAGRERDTDRPGLPAQAIYLSDGQVLIRSGAAAEGGSPAPESALLARLASAQPGGSFSFRDAQGQAFSGSFRRSERYPLLVASLQPDARMLGPWAQRSATKLGLLALALGALWLGLRTLARMLRALATSESVYRRLFEDVADGVLVLSPGGRILGLNAAALRLTGHSEAQAVVGHSLREFFPHPIDPASGRPSELPRQRMLRALAGERLHFEYSFEAPRSRQHFDCDVRLSAFRLDGAPQLLCLVRDLSEERRFSRQQEYLANHDALTGLPNRHSLLRQLDQRIETWPQQRFELVFINLARFKEVNEAFGHRAADMVLEISARRLERQLALHGWRLARAGGTDFVAVPPLPDHGGPGLPTETACELMLRVSREPITMGDTAVELHLKLGSAEFPADAPDAGQLLRCADMAAARARTVVGSQVRYSKDFEHSPGHDLKMRAELSAAIRDGQLQLAWQPKLWLESREIEGVEALLRWHHPRLGWVPPSEFIALAESTELIYPLTRWVIGAALAQMARWQAMGQPLKVAVNISANNLLDPDFNEHVKALLLQHGVEARWLELELTESALALNPELVLRRLQDLRTAGLTLALDDFGTGFSSLSYVSQFPFTTIKIDRSFVSALLRSPRDRHVAESTVALGRKLGLRTVAEGIEDDATAAALMALECDVGQGYLFARPLLGQAFEHWRRSHQAMLQAAQQQALGPRR